MAVVTDWTTRILGLSSKQQQVRTIKPADIPFQSYLDKAYDKVRPNLGPDLGNDRTRLAISVFLRSSGKDHIYAGKFDNRLHYSGSLIKVAAMFAAYKLRAEAKALANSGANFANETAFFAALKQQFNPAGAVQKIKDRYTGTNPIRQRPTLPDILKVTGFGGALQVKFAQSFYNGLATDDGFFTAYKDILATLPRDADDNPIQNATSRDAYAKIGHMYRMIVPSDDCSAGECISRLSYPYINVKLMEKVGDEDGFFDAGLMKGIWLAGDYIEDWCPAAIKAKRQDFVRIDTENDCDQTKDPPFCGSAENTTSKQMARFVLKIITKELVEPDSSGEMRDLLHEAEQVGDISFLDVDPDSHRSTGTIARQFDIDGTKIGQGPIKPDPARGSTRENPLEVRSEGMIIKWRFPPLPPLDPDPDLKKKFDDRKLTGEIAVCWQNLSNRIPNTNGLIDLLNKSIRSFVEQVPLTSI
jgi:hypothetical protein